MQLINKHIILKGGTIVKSKRKQLVFAGVIIIVIALLTSCGGVADILANIILYGDFGVTTARYDDDSDWDEIVNDLFGAEYRVADWNDLKAIYNNGEDLLDLFDGLEMTEYKDSAYVKRNGDPTYSSTRYYSAARHEHNKPSSYMAHDNIDNYLLSLGSWYGSNEIMAIKKSDSET